MASNHHHARHIGQVDVKHFLDRQGSNAYSPANHRRYTYLLWVAQAGRFQPVTQHFYKFPTPECVRALSLNHKHTACMHAFMPSFVCSSLISPHSSTQSSTHHHRYNWNYLDELVCGHNDELRYAPSLAGACWSVWPLSSERPFIDPNQIPNSYTRASHRPETKYRRKLLQVCPGEELLNRRLPPSPQQLEAYVDKLRKLLEHAAARCCSSRRPKEWSEEEPPLLDAVKVAPALQVGMLNGRMDEGVDGWRCWIGWARTCTHGPDPS